VAERKAISKKLRFEVFKRDSFTCQYCGKSAPEVVLEVDHINPVKNNGDNNILNLVTSCMDCNRGRGAKELSDNTVLKAEKEQLKNLEEKRSQMKMLIKWKEGLKELEYEQVEQIGLLINEYLQVFLNNVGEEMIRKLIKKHGFNIVYDSVEASVEKFDGKNVKPDEIINYIPNICKQKEMDIKIPFNKDRNYIYGILRNRHNLDYTDNRDIKTYLMKYIRTEKDVEDVKYYAKICKSIKEFLRMLDDLIGGN